MNRLLQNAIEHATSRVIYSIIYLLCLSGCLRSIKVGGLETVPEGITVFPECARARLPSSYDSRRAGSVERHIECPPSS